MTNIKDQEQEAAAHYFNMSNMRSKHKQKAKAPQRKGNNLRRFIVQKQDMEMACRDNTVGNWGKIRPKI